MRETTKERKLGRTRERNIQNSEIPGASLMKGKVIPQIREPEESFIRRPVDYLPATEELIC